MVRRIVENLKRAATGRLLRRATALALCVSMALPTSAMGYVLVNSQVLPTVVTDTNEFPTITVELNAVVGTTAGSAADALTGELEVALRVTTGKVGGVDQPFQSLSVALEYSDLLTPVGFDGEPVVTTGTSGLSKLVNMESLKKDNRISTAGAQVSAKEGGGGYLLLTAESHNGVVLNDSVLVVVNFKMKMEDERLKTNWLPVSTNATSVSAWTTGDSALIKLAPASVVDGGRAEQEVVYHSVNNLLYYSDMTGDYAGTGAAGTLDDGHTVPKLAEDLTIVDADDPTNEAKKTVLKNIIPISTDPAVEEGKLNYTLVNKLTYDAEKREDAVLIEFFDWDDTQIGALVVHSEQDARKAVNDYVRDNFIHEDLRLGLTTSATEAEVSDLTRAATYRGKYPSAPSLDGVFDPSFSGGNIDDSDGSNYKLSNKLDYVFLKRPMVQDEIDKNKWVQVDADEDGKGDWDTKYPYIYGWAVTDLNTVFSDSKTTWTTLGMGELSSYSGASSGGYPTSSSFDPLDPAELTVEGQSFAFADFDFSKTHQNPGTVYAVKAVYEPGTDLMNLFSNYRIISTAPYYLKLNDFTAEQGGAYTATVYYERSNENLYSDHLIRGVARIRDPIVRQDVTPDELWKVIEEYSINHNLPNQSDLEAYTGKGDVYYIKVEVSNAEIMEISMTVTAKMNKVDYHIMEAYGKNFVGGDTKSDGDDPGLAKMSPAPRASGQIIDNNYNYYVDGESNTDDAWYDAPYSDREGSKGFVLSASLNRILLAASNYGLSDYEYQRYVTDDALKDVNLRYLNGQTGEDSSSIGDTIREKIHDAVDAAKALHDAHDDTYWDTVHDCANLTYHQLQGFILDGSLSHGEGAITGLTWCHLHKECAALSSTKPKNWSELLDKAKSSPDDVELLTRSDIEDETNGFYLRKDENGTKFSSGAELLPFLVAAIDDGCTTWDQVQDHIISGGVNDSHANPDNPDDPDDTLTATEYSRATYWWYDGKDPDFSSLAGTLAAAKDTATAVTTVDDVSATRAAKINRLKSVFTASKSVVDGGGNPTAEWIAATENLAMTRDGRQDNTFTSWQSFRDDYLVDALKKTASPTWYQIQYHVIHKGDGGYAFPSAATAEAEGTADATEYWWHNGNVKITDFDSLFKAAKAGKLTPDSFPLTLLYSSTNKVFQFRSDFAGTKYTDIEDFIADFNKYADDEDAESKSWERAQYHLIHGGLFTTNPGRMQTEGANYYWWKNEGTYSAVSFTLSGDNEARANALAAALVDAAFRKTYNGNDSAWDKLTPETVETIMKSGRLVKGLKDGTALADTTDFFADFIYYASTDLDTIKAAMVSILPAQTNITTAPYRPYAAYTVNDNTWHEVQYRLLDGVKYSGDNITKDADFWWKIDDTREAKEDPKEQWTKLAGLIKKIATEADTDALEELSGWFDADVAGNMGFTSGDGDLDSDVEGIPWDELDYDGAGCGTGESFKITWTQIQGLFINYYQEEGDWILPAQSDAEGLLDSYGIEAPSEYGTLSLGPTSSLMSLSPRMTLSSKALTSVALTGTLDAATEEQDEKDAQIAALTEENEALRAENEDLQAQLDAALALLAAYQSASSEDAATTAATTTTDNEYTVTPDADTTTDSDSYTMTTDTVTTTDYTVTPDAVVTTSDYAVGDDTVADQNTLIGDPVTTTSPDDADPPADTGQGTAATNSVGAGLSAGPPESPDSPEEEDDTMTTTVTGPTATAWTPVLRVQRVGLPDPGGGRVTHLPVYSLGKVVMAI